MSDERRNDKRLTIDKLPECLKVVTFKLGFIEEYSAEAINASKYGMCFIAYGLNTMDISKGQDLTISILPHSYKLKSKVVYAVNAEGKRIKFGVNFYNGFPIEKYHELINVS